MVNVDARTAGDKSVSAATRQVVPESGRIEGVLPLQVDTRRPCGTLAGRSAFGIHGIRTTPTKPRTICIVRMSHKCDRYLACFPIPDVMSHWSTGVDRSALVNAMNNGGKTRRAHKVWEGLRDSH